MAKKRIDYSKTPEPSTTSPFAALAHLRADLPPGDSPSSPPSPLGAAPVDDFTRLKLIVRREKSGRGGKTVTIIEGLLGPPQRREEVARTLKKKLGCGATVEGEHVVLHGDIEDRVAALLRTLGATQVVMATARK